MSVKKKTYFLASLGCAKNTVDSTSMATLLDQQGMRGIDDPQKAEYLIVNTCGFIEQARQESIEVLNELAASKTHDQKLIAAGCMPQLFTDMLLEKVQGIDGILGTRRWMDIYNVISTIRDKPTQPGPYIYLPSVPDVGHDDRGLHRIAPQGTSAYLKIADGCRRSCAFCSIPLIKGSLVSRPMQSILEDVRYLEDHGMQEIILIAQDTTDYGFDLGLKDGLPKLLEEILKVSESIPWIRILYTYPGYISDHLIDLMASQPRILPYLDIPLQHADPAVLKKMKRPWDIDWVHNILAKMRAKIPHLALRSTFIVGYPGETDREFSTLLDFIKVINFDHIGAFPFSFEHSTPSEPLGDPVSSQEKTARLETLMSLQERISLKRNKSFIGKRMDVLIEGENDGFSVGRSYRDAPEIDGLVIVEGTLPVGKISQVDITGAMIHDLSGVPARE